MEATEKPRVLFVDDDPNILSGLRRTLRERRGEWEMSFIGSGSDALLLMERETADVVVSDMRMPEMDGASLLTRIKELYPQTVRIILSGFSDKETIIRTVGPSHQYLSKPCETSLLVAAIRRSLTLRRLLTSDSLRAAVSGLAHLPTPPRMFAEIMAELDSNTGSVSSLSRKIGADVGISAQILKLTNSAYFGLPTTVSDIDDAIRLLGFDTVKAVFLFAGVFSTFAGQAQVAAILERVSQRSLKNSHLAKLIAQSEGLPQAQINATACAGLLAHVGTVMLAVNFPDPFAKVMERAEAEHISIDGVEQEVFQATHGVMGAYLLGLWGFNDPIVEAVAYHHHPGQSGARENGALAIVHVAQCLAQAESRPEYLEKYLERELDLAYLKDAGVLNRLPRWIDLFRTVNKEWQSHAA